MQLWILTVPFVANFFAYDAPWQPKTEDNMIGSKDYSETEYEEYFLDDYDDDEHVDEYF